MYMPTYSDLLRNSSFNVSEEFIQANERIEELEAQLSKLKWYEWIKRSSLKAEIKELKQYCFNQGISIALNDLFH